MDDKPTTITAGEWDKVAADVEAGRCEVTNPLYNHAISNIEPIKPNSAGWDVAITDAKSTYRSWSDIKLTVHWLAPQPVSEDAAAKELTTVDTAEVAKMKAIIVALEAERDSLRAANARLRAAMERIIALAPAGKPKYPNSASESDYVWHGRDSAYWHAAEIFAEAQAGGEE